MMMNNNFPNYKKASTMAWHTLMEFGVKSFPFSLTDLLDNFPKIHLLSYLEYSEQLSTLNDEEVYPEDIELMVESGDGAIQKMLNGKKFNILYDGDCEHISVQRMRFTLAHELGHYVLRHFYNQENDNFKRRPFDHNTKSDFLENEANRFARELLAPIFILGPMLEKGYNTRKISHMLDVSEDTIIYAADFYSRNKNNYINNKEYAIFSDYFKDVEHHFTHNVYMPNNHYYSESMPEYIYCKKCNWVQGMMVNNKYCMNCGSDSLMEINMDTYFMFHDQYEAGSINPPGNTLLKNDDAPVNCLNCDSIIIDPESKTCTHCKLPVRNECFKDALTLPSYANFCYRCGQCTAYGMIRRSKMYK